jgi:hypothetical protein
MTIAGKCKFEFNFNQYICVQFDREVLFTPQLHIHEERCGI